MTQNALNNMTVDADFAVNHSTAGAAILSVANANAAATAQANMITGIQPTAFAAFDNWNVAADATKNWSAGILQSDGAWYLHQSAAAFPSAAVIKATTAGEVTMPRQPVFLALLPATDLNVTGAGAAYTLGSGNALTVTQQGTGMATNGIYTAPVTGWYQFSASMNVLDITALMTQSQIALVCSDGRTIFGDVLASFTVLSAGVYQYNVNGTINLVAGDTMTAQLTLLNGAGNTADVAGAAGLLFSHFAGSLLC